MDDIYATHLKMTIGLVMGSMVCVGFWALLFTPGK